MPGVAAAVERRSSVRSQSLEHRAERGARQVSLRGRLLVAEHPARDYRLGAGLVQTIRDLLGQALRTGAGCRVNDSGHHTLGHVSRDAAGRRRRGAGVEEGLLLDWQKRGEEAQQLSSERMTLLEDLGPGSPRLPRLGQDLEHQIFSRLTRNALNSGVRALASPTNGVSALASQ